MKNSSFYCSRPCDRDDFFGENPDRFLVSHTPLICTLGPWADRLIDLEWTLERSLIVDHYLACGSNDGIKNGK